MTESDDFTCPITLEVMNDPVVLHSEAGRSYERSAIQEHLRLHPYLDPSTGELSSQPLQFTRNQILKNIIGAWKENNDRDAQEARLVAAQDAETRKQAASALAVRQPPDDFFFTF